MKNIIFCFSGTGNSLHVGKVIANAITDCEVVLVNKNTKIQLEGKYQRIGFIYPTYFAGIPLMMKKFIENLDFSNVEVNYVFSIATYGGTVGNGVKLVGQLLRDKGIHLDYGNQVKMFSNYLVMYKMSTNIIEKNKKSDILISLIVQDIKDKKLNKIKNLNPIWSSYYNKSAKNIAALSNNFTVDSSCNGCGLCVKLCPAENIILEEKKPSFTENCEQCMSCIQYCPREAINYKDKTQSRGRYQNPYIRVNELIKRDSVLITEI